MKELLSIIIQILWLSLLAQIIISWLVVAGVKNEPRNNDLREERYP